MDILRQGNALQLAPKDQRLLTEALTGQGQRCSNRLALYLHGEEPWSRDAFEDAHSLIEQVPTCLLSAPLRVLVDGLRRQWAALPPGSMPQTRQIMSFPDVDELVFAWVAAFAPTTASSAALRSRLTLLAEWETAEAGDAKECAARAVGAQGIRRYLLSPAPLYRHEHPTLRITRRGHPDSPEYAHVSIPPASLLAQLGLHNGPRILDMHDVRPLEPGAFFASIGATQIEDLAIDVTGEDLEAGGLCRDTVTGIHLNGPPGAVIATALALVNEPPDRLERVRIADCECAAAVAEQLPADWSHCNDWLIRRDPQGVNHVQLLGDTANGFLARLRAMPGGLPLLRFLWNLEARLGALPPDEAARSIEEARAHARFLLQSIEERRALLDELRYHLVDLGPCVDASILCLNNMYLASLCGAAKTSEDAGGVLLRMGLFDRLDHEISALNARKENLEEALALRSLLDFRLAELIGIPFAPSSRPHYAEIGGMNAAPVGTILTRDAWPEEMHRRIDRFLNEEVREGFPSLHALMDAPGGPGRRAMEQLLDDPGYQAKKRALEEAFLDAEERAEGDDATPQDREAYEQIQLTLPRDLSHQRLALMEGWLLPLRQAFPPPPDPTDQTSSHSLRT